MKRSIASYITGLASLSFVFAFMYEGKIGLGQNLETNRALLEARVRNIQTNHDLNETNEKAVEVSMSSYDQYNTTLKTEYKLFGCSATKPCR